MIAMKFVQEQLKKTLENTEKPGLKLHNKDPWIKITAKNLLARKKW